MKAISKRLMVGAYPKKNPEPNRYKAFSQLTPDQKKQVLNWEDMGHPSNAVPKHWRRRAWYIVNKETGKVVGHYAGKINLF